jgi:hypothetical protein
MNTLSLIAGTVSFPSGLLGILLTVAIVCIVVWAVYALLQWAGIAIPRPIQIILIALCCIIAIYWLFKIAAQLM